MRLILAALLAAHGIAHLVGFVVPWRLMASPEGDDRGRWLNHVHVALWTITFALFVAAIVTVVRGTRWREALIGVVASAIVFQVLTLAQPPIAIAAMLTVIAALTLQWRAPRPAHV